MRLILVLFFLGFFVSCEKKTLEGDLKNPSSEEKGELSATDAPPVSSSVNPTNAYRGIQTIVTLSYTDANSDQATSCAISNISNLTVSTPCTCNLGICTVGVEASSGSTYTGAASFDYTVTANSQESNVSTVSFTINQIGTSDTEEWVRVPANAGGMGLSEFYVMKYEAKAWNDGNTNSTIDGGEIDTDGLSVATGSNIPVSIADNQPWRDINANDSAAECESLGPNYHLISNPEWMAMARDIENVDSNWTGQSVGIGCLYRGNSGEATVGLGTTNGDSCGYDGANPEEGTGRDLRAKHTLSNGQEVFDLAANVDEWVDFDKDTVGFQEHTTVCSSSGGFIEFPSVSASCPGLVDVDYNTSNGGYDSNQGIGQYYASGGSGAIQRGGRPTNTSNAGVFLFYIGANASSGNTVVGFRCVYRP